MTKLYRKVKERGVQLSHVCEVGVYLPETSNILGFIKDGIRTSLVEADPGTVEKIKTFFPNDHVIIYPFAVWDRNGTIKLSRANASTFVSELESSPAIVNDQYRVKEEETFEVPCKVFSEIDDGTIDLLSVDIEGSEWYVLKHMKSRPRILSVETHGKFYLNPFFNEIMEWTRKNGYVIWYKDNSDTVFVREGLFKPSFSDKAGTFLAALKTSWKKFKGRRVARLLLPAWPLLQNGFYDIHS